jgi:hypothetical protein
MAAGKYDIVIDQGADFALEIALAEDGSPIVLTSNHVATAQLRPTHTSSTLTATFTCTITSGSQGKLNMAMGHAVTSNVAAGKYYYDLELQNTSADSITRIIEGVARVTPNVTR